MKRPLFLTQPDAWRSRRTLSNPANDANPFYAPVQTGYPRSWWVTVLIIALAGFLVVVLTGCGKREQETIDVGVPVQRNDHWETFGPDEFGVKCYRRRLVDHIQCLKVKP